MVKCIQKMSENDNQFYGRAVAVSISFLLAGYVTKGKSLWFSTINSPSVVGCTMVSGSLVVIGTGKLAIFCGIHPKLKITFAA